jgi:hypothetical protein
MAEGKSSGGGNTGMLFIIVLVVLLGLFKEAPGGFNFGGTSSNGVYTPPKDEAGIQQEVYRLSDEVKELKKQADLDKRIGPLSTLAKTMRLSASNVWSDNPNEEYLELYVEKGAPSKIQLSGMEIRSAVSGASVTIPNGVYRPEFSRTNSLDPIILYPGNRVYLITGKSPMGYSFQANKCSGYFSQFHEFTPSLSYSCPSPRDEGYPSVPLKWRSACFDYIDSISQCSMPLNFLPENIGPECTEYITTKINYDSCVETHRFDKDFYTGNWYVYLERPEELWLPSREFIKLIDRQKQTINYTEIQ